MKITEVKTYSPVYPVKDPFSNALRTTRERAFGLVEITTDSGIIGWGEGATVPARRPLDAHVVGRNPFDYEVIWEGLHKAGTDTAAISAVDIALWDIMGKALKQPIYQLLGGAFRTRVQAYATGLFRRERADPTAALVEEARGYVDQGFRAMKMKVGFGPDYDIKNVAAVRRAIGDEILFAVDANCGYDLGSAIAVGKEMAKNNLLWFEEPIAADDVEGYVEIRRALNIRISGAEQLRGRWAFRRMIQERALDIIQPDVCVCGGFTEYRKISAMASANHVRVIPHMFGTAIRLAATLHLLAALPDSPRAHEPFPALLEYDMSENALRTELAREPIRHSGGIVAIPQGPGLGIEIDREVLQKYC
ncbi:MAG TPA: mandelate racemase/muconate lactonizing enzyme family protein [Burkholderiales bacterium]|nr:mandelate racemase/muconate lactonizing enzyme family protein [Burkholderiales bacterium]